MLLDDDLTIDEVVEHTDEDRSKGRDGMDDVKRKVDLRPAKNKGMNSEDKTTDEEYAELKSRTKLQLKVHVLTDGVSDDGLHDIPRELRLHEGHIVLITVYKASHPEEVSN